MKEFYLCQKALTSERDRLKATCRLPLLPVWLFLMLLFTGNVFTASAQNMNLDQARNGGVGDPPIDPVEWVNGNLNAQHAHYYEGQSVPYRLILKDISAGPHVLIIGYDIRDQNKSALDFITHFQRINEVVDPLSGLSGPFGDPNTFPIPPPASNVMINSMMQPLTAFNALPAAERLFTCYNAVITNIEYESEGDPTALHSETRLRIEFHKTGPPSDVVFAWGGHIASRTDWGEGNSAFDVNGSPYHMRLIEVDGFGGNQDRSLQANAVTFVPTCDLTGPVEVCPENTYIFSATTNAPTPVYQWAVTGGAVIDGSSTEATVSVIAPASGSFTVSVTIQDNSGGILTDSTVCSLDVNVSNLPVADAGEDQVLCSATGSAVFTLNGTVSGGTGTWMVVSGTATIDDPGLLTTTVTVTGTAVLALSVPSLNQVCADGYDEITLVVNTIPQCAIAGDAPTCVDLVNIYSYNGAPCPTCGFEWAVTGDAEISGNDNEVSVTVSASGGCGGTYTVHLTVTDNDCVSSCSQTYTWSDDLAPVLSGAGADLTISCGADPVFTAPVASDNCDGSPEVILVSDVTVDGECPQEYVRTRTWMAVDDCGNQSLIVSQVITVIDDQAPVLSGAGPDMVIFCEDEHVFTAPVASDDCDPNPEVTLLSDEITPGNCPQEMIHTRVWIAVDACGNMSGPVSQTITVVDDEPPVLSGQGPDMTVSCGEPLPFTPPVATDNCDPNPQVVMIADVIVPGDCPQEFTQTCTWVAVDACGNMSEPVSQTITVVDDQAPVLSGQGPDMTVNCGEPLPFTPPVATDNCDPNPEVVMISDVVVPGDCPQEFTQTCTWVAVDACGNMSEPVSQTIAVVDDQAPVLSGGGPDMTVECGDALPFTPPSATDNCDPDPTVIMISDVIVQGDCPQEYIQSCTWAAVDACGNMSAPYTQTITVIDNTPPVIGELGPDMTVECGEPLPFTPPTATDNCDPEVEIIMISETIVSLECPGVFSQTCCWVAVDDCGNVSETVCQTITVVDNTPPEIGEPGPDMTINCGTDPVFTPPTATDHCDDQVTIVMIDELIIPGDCPGTYSQTCTWVAIDDCGNQSESVSQTITVVDNIAPVVLIPAGSNITIPCNSVPMFTPPIFTDNCDNDVTVQIVSTMSIQNPGGSTSSTMTWVGVDDCGNVSGEVSQTITVLPCGPSHVPGTGVELTVSAYPNPFTEATNIVFTSPVSAKVQVEIYNMQGAKVATLYNNEVPANEEIVVRFNREDLPAGNYFYVVKCNEYIHRDKLIITR